jgi:hypothetical protein
MDGKLVRVRARYEAGWEGDNFLVDPTDAVAPKGKPRKPRASLWINCEPRYERLVCGPIYDASVFRAQQGAVGTFIGYFHFVPDTKSQWKDGGDFETGPLQFAAIPVSDVLQQGR